MYFGGGGGRNQEKKRGGGGGGGGELKIELRENHGVILTVFFFINLRRTWVRWGMEAEKKEFVNQRGTRYEED